MANLPNIGRAVRKITLITLATAASLVSSYGQSIHHAIEKSKTQHTSLLNETASNIIYRTANPFPTDPKKDLSNLQLKFIDMSNSSEREFYNAMQKETDSNSRYFVFADPSGDELIKRGAILYMNGQSPSVLFERKGTEKKLGISAYQYAKYPSGVDAKKLTTIMGDNAIALRRSTVSGIIEGYFFGNALPRTIYEYVADAEFGNKTMRVESIVDKSSGLLNDGSPIFSRLEMALPTLVNELYLHFKTNKDVVIWAGRFGYPLRVQDDVYGKKLVLSEEKKVSLLSKLEGTTLLYNPLDLSVKEVYSVQSNIPSGIDILIVDKKNNNIDLRVVKKEDKDVAIMSAQYWYQADAVPNVKNVVLTKDLEQVIEEGSMVTLPVGTTVIDGGGNYTGILVKKPYKMPVAKFYAKSAVWISSDADELMTLVSNSYVGELGNKSGELTATFNGKKIVVDHIKKTVGKPDPFFMLEENNNIIKVEFGVNWTNPWIVAEKEMNRIGAYAMTYDFKTGKFTYHMNGSIPSARTITTDRPSYTNIPKIIEK